eukprot:5841789-Pleurochrysis_carterae.AAC.1
MVERMRMAENSSAHATSRTQQFSDGVVASCSCTHARSHMSKRVCVPTHTHMHVVAGKWRRKEASRKIDKAREDGVIDRGQDRQEQQSRIATISYLMGLERGLHQQICVAKLGTTVSARPSDHLAQRDVAINDEGSGSK